jgi:hypothetical protein
MSQLMEWEILGGRPDSQRTAANGADTGVDLRIRHLLHRACYRLVAPAALRQRILASLPHRGGPVGECRQ